MPTNSALVITTRPRPFIASDAGYCVCERTDAASRRVYTRSEATPSATIEAEPAQPTARQLPTAGGERYRPDQLVHQERRGLRDWRVTEVEAVGRVHQPPKRKPVQGRLKPVRKKRQGHGQPGSQDHQAGHQQDDSIAD